MQCRSPMAHRSRVGSHVTKEPRDETTRNLPLMGIPSFADDGPIAALWSSHSLYSRVPTGAFLIAADRVFRERKEGEGVCYGLPNKPGGGGGVVGAPPPGALAGHHEFFLAPR